MKNNEITLKVVQAIGKRVISGVKAGRELADLVIANYHGTRDEIISSLVNVCQSQGSKWPKKDGVFIGFNNKAGDEIPEIRAFRSARVLIYLDLDETGHVLTKEEKEQARKAADEKAADEKAAEKAAIIADTLKGVKELTPEIALQALARMLGEKTLGTKERKAAEKAIQTLVDVFTTV